MSRLKLDMSLNDALFSLSEGNPGAISVIMESVKVGDQIDPDGMGAWGFLLNLDQMEIYGPRIWILYKDLCKESISDAIAMVRSVQMGLLSAEKLNDAMDRKCVLDVVRTVDLLKEKLPNFNA